MKTAISQMISVIQNMQKTYIEQAKGSKDKSVKVRLDAILTATTILKINADSLLELERQQIIDAVNAGRTDDQHIIPTEYYNNTYNK